MDSFTPTVFRSRIFFADVGFKNHRAHVVALTEPDGDGDVTVVPFVTSAAANRGTLTLTDKDGEAVTVCTRLRDVPPRLLDAFDHGRGDA